MPECLNCGSKVSKQFAVSNWHEDDVVPACPNCEDRKLEDGKVHEYKS